MKALLDDLSGKTALEAENGALSEVLRERARVYDEHQAALAKHDEKWTALAADIAALDEWPLEEMVSSVYSRIEYI